MEVFFLGTGTSEGVPVIAQPDHIELDLDNPKNWRTRTSVHVVMDGCHVQVDAAPEFRLQCIQNNIRKIDHFILTHGHADHIQGWMTFDAFAAYEMVTLYRSTDMRTGYKEFEKFILTPSATLLVATIQRSIFYLYLPSLSLKEVLYSLLYCRTVSLIHLGSYL